MSSVNLFAISTLRSTKCHIRLLNYDIVNLNRNYTTETKKFQKLSYAHGSSSSGKTFLQTTIGKEIDKVVDLYGDREAIVDCAQRIRKNFTEYKHDIDRLAAGLLTLNFKRGERIGIWCPNRYEWILTQFATAKLGLVLTSLNPAYQTAEIEYCLRKVGATGLVMTDNFKTQDYYKLITAAAPEIKHSKPGHITSSKLPDLKALIMISEKDFPGTFKFEDILKAGGRQEIQQMETMSKEVDMDDNAMIQFTSGTTGKPKAVIMSHHNLVNGAHVQSDRLGISDQNHRQCVIAPMFHSIACGSPIIGAIYGSSVVLPAPSFNAGITIETIHKERCTSIVATPTMFLDMLNHPDFNKMDLTSLRNGAIGGATCAPEVIKAVMTKMHCKGLVVGYGATETCGAVTSHTHDESFECKIASDGQIYDYMEIKIVNEQDAMVPMGTAGEICVRGYKVMKGYWDDEEMTKKVIKNQWYHTGDVGVLLEGGRVKLLDRIKDMIIRGGENISPREIEEYLIQHPKINEAHVIGVPDKRLGEEVCVWIKLNSNESLTAEQVKQFCTGQISHYKIPKYIQFVNSFPKTATGKVKKTEMRLEMAKIMSIEQNQSS